jgi:cytochrome P450
MALYSAVTSVVVSECPDYLGGDSIVSLGYDLQSPGFFADPYPALARLRQDDPLYWHEPLGVWLVTRYADVRAVSRDRRMSCARMGFLITGDDEKSQVVRRRRGPGPGGRRRAVRCRP